MLKTQSVVIAVSEGACGSATSEGKDGCNPEGERIAGSLAPQRHSHAKPL